MSISSISFLTVTIFVRAGDPECATAREFFEQQKHIRVMLVDIAAHPGEVKNMVGESVPEIWVGDTYVGGARRLKRRWAAIVAILGGELDGDVT